MKILSWDIGIKNLSYCLLSKDEQEIIDWNVINLDDPVIICNGCFKNGNKCNRYAIKDGKCKLHSN